MMAGRPGSPTTASNNANLVGNAFVMQYYNVLHQSPHVVHRFYTDQSKLSCAQVGDNADMVATQDKIHEMIMSMDFGGIRAEIKTVDSQESLNGSVLVMVTGLLTSPDGPVRNFVRTFFLAPQERGYFVLNDIFRYLNGEPVTRVELVSETTPKTHAIAETIDTVESPKADTDEAVIDTIPEEEVHTEDNYEHVEEVEVFATREAPLEENATPISIHHHDAVVKQPEELPATTYEEENSSGIGTVKLSYASILRARSEGSGASLVARPAPQRKVTPVQSVPAVSATQATSIRPSIPSEESAAEIGGDGKSIYAKNLPLNIRQDELEMEFQKFGTLKPGGVNLRNQKQGVCFAFIEFEDSTSAQSAIEASPIIIGGRQIYVEERKFTPTGSTAGRGRPNQGRGYQSDGRGRGYFGGRSGGGGGGGGGRGYNNTNGYRRGDDNTGNIPNASRRVAAN